MMLALMLVLVKRPHLVESNNLSLLCFSLLAQLIEGLVPHPHLGRESSSLHLLIVHHGLEVIILTTLRLHLFC